MKNIKKSLKVSAACAILCVSMQLSPMGQNHYDHQDHHVNPYLSAANIRLLENRIRNLEETLNNPNLNLSEKDIKWLRKKLEHNKKIYYGNKSYTREEIVKMDYQRTIGDRIRHAIE